MSIKQQIMESLKQAGVVVMRSDTIYGVMAAATSKKAVDKLYAIKKRAYEKQSIVLISDPNSVPAHNELIEFYTEANDAPTSIIVPASDEPEWILRGGNSVAYRVIKEGLLKEVIDAVGPLVAPSANPEGLPPARTIDEAKAYFGDNIDMYFDGGEVPETAHPSRIIRIHDDGSVEQLR